MGDRANNLIYVLADASARLCHVTVHKIAKKRNLSTDGHKRRSNKI